MFSKYLPTMNTRKINKRFAQNSIDYIVYHNPDSVGKFLYECGYEVPKNTHSLVKVIKELIQKEGKPIISELLKLHPDKKAILSVSKRQKKPCNACGNDNYFDEDNFCGACGHSNYNGSGDEDSFLDQFTDKTDTELQRYYDKIVKKSNADPEDQKLAQEVQLVWNEIRQRKTQEDGSEKSQTLWELISNNNEVLVMGLIFIAGYLVGNAQSSS